MFMLFSLLAVCCLFVSTLFDSCNLFELPLQCGEIKLYIRNREPVPYSLFAGGHTQILLNVSPAIAAVILTGLLIDVVVLRVASSIMNTNNLSTS